MTGEARVRTIAALAGLAAVGMPAAGFAGALSPQARVALVLIGGWVVPAILCAPLARRFVTGAGIPALAFFFALSLHAAWSEAFRIFDARFSVYADALTWLLIVAYGTMFFFAWARRRERPSLRAWRPRFSRATVLLLVSAGALAAIAAWSRGEFTVEEDAFDHIGYVRRMIDFDDMRPDGVLALPARAQDLSPDPRKGALHPAIAWVAGLAGANPAVVWATLPLVLYPAFVLAFVAFSRALLAGRAALLVCVALFMLSYGGTAFQLAAAAAYGQNLAAAWFWALAALVLYGREEPPPLWRRRRLAVAVLALCGVLVHVGVALHAGLLAASLVLLARWLGFGYRRAALDALSLVAAAALAVVVRLGFSMGDTNVLHSHVQGVLFVGDDLFVASPFEILRQFGMVFLGGLVLLPGLLPLTRRSAHARAVLALCVLPVCIAFVPPLATALFAKGSYLVFRGLLNAPVLAASAILIAATVGAARRGRTWVRVAAAAALAVWMLAFLRPALDATLADAGKERGRTDPATRELARHVELLGTTQVVLSDPGTAYLLSAYTAHRFVAVYDQHANPRDPYALDRLRAARDVLSPFADASRALEACRRYGVGYVVVNPRSPAGFLTGWDPALFPATVARLRAIGRPFQELATAKDFAVFRVWSELPAEQAPDPLPAPVSADVAAPASCVVLAPGRAFEATGLEVTPSSVSPGDSVTITLGYRRDEATPFGLPFLAHVRFDHESLFAARSYPGDKYVRRFDDRRRGVVTRFRADFRPGAGVFDPDLWPMGVALSERVPFVVPPHALPGRYRVELCVVRDSLLPNFHARDLLFNRDHYSGTPCASIEVRARAGESP